MKETPLLPQIIKTSKSARLFGGIGSAILIFFIFLIPLFALKPLGLNDLLMVAFGLCSLALLLLLKCFQSVHCSEEGLEFFKLIFKTKKILWDEIEKAEFVRKTGSYQLTFYPYSIIKFTVKDGGSFELVNSIFFNLKDVLIICDLLKMKAFNADVNIDSKMVAKEFVVEKNYGNGERKCLKTK